MTRRQYKSAVPLVERRTPARPASVESDVLVPAIQAAISGLLAGLLAGIVGLVAGAERPATIGAVAGAVVLASTWALGLRDRRALLWAIERTIGADLDGDGDVGPPEREPVRIEVVDRKRKAIRFLDVDLSDEQLAGLARTVLRPGGTFSRRALPSGLVSDEQYSALVAQLLAAGLLAHRGRGLEAGVELTAAGRSWLRRYG